MTSVSFVLLVATLGFFVVLLCLFLYEWVHRFADRTAQDVIPYLRKANLERIRDLFDPTEEKYLRLNLPQMEFRKIQWKRCRLALEYARDLAHNARVFQQWGKCERSRSRQTMNFKARRVSLDLTIACAQCRICALIVRCKLHWWLLRMAFLPFSAPPRFESLLRLGSIEMLSFYEKIKTNAIDLGRLYGENYQALLIHSV